MRISIDADDWWCNIIIIRADVRSNVLVWLSHTKCCGLFIFSKSKVPMRHTHRRMEQKASPVVVSFPFLFFLSGVDVCSWRVVVAFFFFYFCLAFRHISGVDLRLSTAVSTLCVCVCFHFLFILLRTVQQSSAVAAADIRSLPVELSLS